MALDNIPSSSLAAVEGWDEADRLFGDLAQDPMMRSLLYDDGESPPPLSKASRMTESDRERGGSTLRLVFRSTDGRRIKTFPKSIRDSTPCVTACVGEGREV